MNLGPILGLILIASGIALSVALVVNTSTGNQPELLTFFSAYAGICLTTGTITAFRTREKSISLKTKMREIRVFSEKY